MSKSGQQSPASLNLGNQTYDRGVSDGLHGRPKAIKKTHTHAHRYHAGYRHGNEQRLDVRRHRVSEFNNPDGVVIATHGEGAKKLGFWGMLKSWLVRP